MASLDLMISQYDRESEFGQLIALFLEKIGDEVQTARDVQKQVRADTAIGVWLDAVASRVRLTRPSDSSNYPAFGFDDAGQPFQSAPFRDSSVHGLVGVSDGTFRPLVLARFVALISSGSASSIQTCARFLDPASWVLDHRDLSITLFTDQQERLQRAYDLGCLPVPSGVLLRFQPLSTFGFDEAGEPFNAAPMRDAR